MNRSRLASIPVGAILASLLLIGLSIRFLHIFDMQASPLFAHPVMDPGYHDEWARSIVAGKPITAGEPYFRAPLYPYFLAAVYKIGGGNPLHPRIAQAFMGVLSLYLTFLVGRKVLGARTALLAVFLSLLYPIFLYFEGDLLLEPLALFLNLLLLFLLLVADERRRSWLWLLAGLALGLSAITRPNVLLFAPAIPLWLLSRRRPGLAREVLLPGLLVAAGAAAAIVPVTVRNVREGHDLVWIASQGGINFYLGNHEGADGWSATAPGIRKDWWGGIEDSYLIAKREMGKDPNASEVSAYWFARGNAFLRENPGKAVRLFLRKTYLLLHGAEISNNYVIDFAARYSRPFRALPLSYGLIVPLAILGIFSGGWDRRRGLLLILLATYSASIVLFFVCSRYRVPILPILILFSAAGLAALGRDIRRRSRMAALRGGGLVLLVFLLGHDFGVLGRLDWAQGYMDEGVAHLSRGDWAAAAECFREAVRSRPGNRDAEYGLGIALRELGDLEGALVSARRALALEPRDPDVLNSLALTLAAMGRLDEAEVAYRLGIGVDPGLSRLHANLAQLLERQERFGEAVEEYRAALGAGAVDWRLHGNLGTCLIRMGRVEEGVEELRTGVRVSPDLPGPALLLAERLVGAGKRDEALAVLRDAAKSLPGEAGVADALRALEEPPGP